MPRHAPRVPEGEHWSEYYCRTCGDATYLGPSCTCDVDAAREELLDGLADKYGPEFVAWLESEGYDLDDDEFVPAAAYLVYGGEVDEYDDGCLVVAVHEFAKAAR